MLQGLRRTVGRHRMRRRRACWWVPQTRPRWRRPQTGHRLPGRRKVREKAPASLLLHKSQYSNSVRLQHTVCRVRAIVGIAPEPALVLEVARRAGEQRQLEWEAPHGAEGVPQRGAAWETCVGFVHCTLSMLGHSGAASSQGCNVPDNDGTML
eukprot:1160653-Pelagomonas_calceolata.AAC.18